MENYSETYSLIYYHYLLNVNLQSKVGYFYQISTYNSINLGIKLFTTNISSVSLPEDI